MSDRTIVTPSEVRGWGNVIGERSTSDFGLYDAVLTSTSATVDSRSRTVFTLGVLTNGTSISLVAVSSSISVGDTPSLTGYLKDNENTGLVGKSVKIYQGSTLLDTVTTGAGGAFSYTGSATTGAGSLTFHAVFSGDGDYGGSTSSDVTVTVSKVNTSLAIDVPLVLVYSDEFNITGTLKDASNNVLNGKTVDLYVGSTKVDSGTTNSSGVVSFTQTPVHMGNHTFQLKFGGDTTYNSVNSETVTRAIGKETAVLSLTSPVNNSSVYTGSSVSVEGSLTDNDGTVMTGKTIVVSEGGSQITTFTTDSNGEFTGSLSGLSTASHSLKFEFVADDYYTGSSVTRSVTVADHVYALTCSASSTSITVGGSVTISGNLKKDGSNWGSQTITLYDGSTSLGTATTDSSGNYSKTISGLAEGQHSIKAVHSNAESSSVTVTVSSVSPSSLAVTGTKSILDYSSGSDSSVITATVKDSSSNPLSGQSVVFKNGSTVLDTKTTDSNGQCTYTYASAGVGDVTITVECSLLQETYELEDCLFYDSASSDKSSNYTTRLSSITHSTDYYQVTTSSTSSTSSYMSSVLVKDLSNIPSHFIVSCDINLPNLVTTTGTDEIGLVISNTNGQTNTESMIDIMSNQAQKGLIARTPWADNRSNGKLTQDIWYTFELEYDGSVATGTIYNGDTTVWNGTLSSSKVINYIGLCELGKNSGYKFRNLKIKPL